MEKLVIENYYKIVVLLFSANQYNISDIPHPSFLSCHSFYKKMLHISDCLLAEGDYSCPSDCTLVPIEPVLLKTLVEPVLELNFPAEPVH